MESNVLRLISIDNTVNFRRRASVIFVAQASSPAANSCTAGGGCATFKHFQDWLSWMAGSPYVKKCWMHYTSSLTFSDFPRGTA